ncbi:MAG TPA: tRNA-uridine aminocarboxypropyltransferase [Fibrobacteria bacterium]|nr:tRNA-uridine aminocarboxypropyltransferase [Fibrobacteria bacterium]HOX52251.1 tRNA-uridine aminocarboxypropyltransferase [Fibrobacteria bacterium]
MRRVDPTQLSHRCPTCGTLLSDCVCVDLPRFHPPTRFLFLQHSTEIRKPTNTARLACRVLSNARCETWNRTCPPVLPADSLLLYPLPGARILQGEELARPRTLVIPDATWAQASRIANVLHNRGLPVASLPPDIQGRWGVRRGGEGFRVSSAEAAAFVLALSGQEDASNVLLGAVAEAGRKILAMRGLPWPGEGSP